MAKFNFTKVISAGPHVGFWFGGSRRLAHVFFLGDGESRVQEKLTIRVPMVMTLNCYHRAFPTTKGLVMVFLFYKLFFLCFK